MQFTKKQKVSKNSFMGTVGNVNSSQGGKYDTYFWNIEKFSTLTTLETDEFYKSPIFYYKGFGSYLSFYPNGRRPHSGYFSLYFFSDYNHPSNNIVHMKLGIKTRSGCTEKWLSRNIVYPRLGGLGLDDAIRRSDFLKRESELAPSDSLTFVIFLSSNAPDLIKGGEKFVEDIGNLLVSGVKSDVVIQVEDVEFKAHSCILAARTPVFSALFEHETVEKTSNKITIKDCEPSIFKEFLNHIYTGRVQNITTETAFSLYRVADKYLIGDLKEICRKHIQDTLSIDSFCRAIELAQSYGEQHLLQYALDYFVKHINLIVKSEEWQRFIEENPREANEILIKAYSSPHKS